MAKKHFDEYVLKIKAQYEEMQRNLDQIAKEAQNNQTDLDFVERLKQNIAPFRANYQRVMYIKMLLDQPNKKEKIPAYKKRLEKAMRELEKSNSTEAVLDENKNIINSVKENK